MEQILKLTLDETWSKCIEMWYDCCYHKDYKDLDIATAKYRWLIDHGYKPHDIVSRCFFCCYAAINGSQCSSCPGQLVDPDFACSHDDYYNYETNRIAFYNKIVELNAIRLRNSWRLCLAKPIRSLEQALQYIIPRRLTLKTNPRVHAWLWWNF